MLELREYQRLSLDKLGAYLRRTTEHGAKAAFVLETDRPYHEAPRFPDLPYVCLRVPTGGGKTLMASHAVGIAAREFLQTEHALCLWLVPSNTILDQTLAALQDRQHPYREALEASFAGEVQVMGLRDALYIQRGVLDGATVIIVCTLAALRVEDTDGRKIYESAGALQHHFSALAAELEQTLETTESGTIPYSLANVLRLRRPLVIVDEAHNARTPLSFETLERFSPSCIIEFTATPETTHRPERGLFASNILHHVSAAELKAEDMVKLPIKLRTRGTWKEVVSDAVGKQRALESLAEDEEHSTGDYLRPIVLFQAQPRRQGRATLTVEVVRQCLIDDFQIPEDHIAVATGETRGIDNIDLFDRACPLRFIITVAALKEGWDCSFAYVLCSVADVHSTRAVEQILGRILRMPRARRREHPELNCAYAFAASPDFMQAANAITDALVENGFQRMEASQLVTPEAELGLPFEPGSLFAQAFETVSEPPNLAALDMRVKEHVSYDEGTRRLTLVGPMTVREMAAVQNCFAAADDRAAVARAFHALQGRTAAPLSDAATREPFSVPLLARRIGNQLEILDETYFLETAWDLAKCDARLSEAEFAIRDAGGSVGEIDVDDAGRIGLRFVEQIHRQLEMLEGEPGWTVAGLANWIDRQIPHRDIPQAQSSLFIHNVLTRLVEGRGFTLKQLARRKFRLCKAIEGKIGEHRQAQAKKALGVLFDPNKVDLAVDPEISMTFDASRYAPNEYYRGTYRFQKHYFATVGELESDGEEFDCAVFIDTQREVKRWVRNLPRESSSFWLQTSSDRFYPDFVAELNDGRMLVVEYKGADRWSDDDSREKRAIGELWADRSGRKCLFVMPKGPDWSAIGDCVSH